MMNNNTLTCPYCGVEIAEGLIECPNCHENLAVWTRVRFSHAIGYNEALALAREGRLDEARARLALALQSKESFAPAHILLAKVNAQQGRWAEAQQSAERARELLPDDERTRELAGAIAAATGAATSEANRPEGQARAEGSRSDKQGRAAGPAAFGANWLGRYQQDIVRAFAVGVGLTTVMALLISRLSGQRSE